MISSTIPHVGQFRLSWDNREIRFAYTIKPDPRKAKRCLNYISRKSRKNRGNPMNPRGTVSPVVWSCLPWTMAKT